MENIDDLMPLSNDWNKERLTQLKKLFPDLFTNEGKLNIDELKKVIDPASVSETERYEFRWFGKSAAKRNAYTPSNATLMFDEKRSLNPNESENIIIEGENLEVLKLLSESYREQVKCIYIDPPYNTGKDFVYSDNFTEDKKPYWENNEITENGIKIDTNVDTDGRYHSNWLNMMYSRLLIAKQLLREDGVIFISIDDNEIANLRKLCDEIFGEGNFVSELVWEKSFAPKNDSKYFSTAHEYILCYAKSKESFELILLERTEEQNEGYKNPDNDLRGNWSSGSMLATTFNEKYTFSVTKPNNEKIYPPKGRCWRYSKEKFEKLIIDNRVWFGENGSNVPRIKRFLNEVKDGVVPMTVLKNKLVGSNQDSSLEMKKLFDNVTLFTFSKPSKLIKFILNTICDNTSDDLILDFFGGSGTTGQAVMQLNQEDGGNRKFILVQIPEAVDESSEAYKAGYKKISDITIERNKRVVEKIVAENEAKRLKELAKNPLFVDAENNPKNLNSDNGLGFKVFKLVKSNFPRVEWAPDVDKTEEENIVLLKKHITDKEAQMVTLFSKNGLISEILLKNGFQLNYKTSRQAQFTKNEILLATDGLKETLICLDDAIATETVDYFRNLANAENSTKAVQKLICLERALDTTKKYNLKHYLGNLFNAF